MNIFTLCGTILVDNKEANNSLSAMDKNAEKSGNSFLKLGELAKKAATMIGTYLTAKTIINFGKSCLEAGSNFEEAMSQVAATMGIVADENNEDFKLLSDAAKQYGASTKFSATEASEALNYMALAGYDAKTSVSALPVVLNLAAAGNMDLASASDMVTDSLSMMGKGVDYAQQLTDEMAKTSQKSNTSVSQLGEAYKLCGASAAELKGGTAELNTLLGAFANVGYKGSEGGTHLRNVLMALKGSTATSAKGMQELGVSAYDSNGNLRDMTEVIKDMKGKLTGLTDAQLNEKLTAIFNTTDIEPFKALLTQVGDTTDNLRNDIENCSNACEDMAETMSNNLKGKITSFKSALEGVEITIYELILKKPATWVVEQATQMLGAINAFVGGLKGKTEVVKSILTSITQNSFFNYVIEWCEYFRDVIEKLGNDTITMLIGKLSSVSSVFNALIEVLKPIAEGIIQGIIKAFDSLIYVYDALVPAVSFVIDILTELGSIILTSITPAIQKMHEAWRTFLQYFVAIVANVLVPIFSTFINMLKELLEENQDKIQKIGEIFSTVFNTIADIVTVVVDTIKDKIYPFLLDLRRSFEDNISIIKEVFKGAFDMMGGVVDTFVGTYNIVYDTIKGVIQYFNEHRTALDLLGVAIGTVTALVLAYNAASIASAVASGAETVAIMALYAADKIAAIGQGALSIATTAWTTVASIATTVTSALGSAIAFLTSPIGIAIVAIGAIIAVGVLLYKNWDKVKEKAIELWKSLKEAFENIKNSISEKIETTKTIVNEKIEAIKNIFSEKFEAAKKKVSEIFETIKNVIQVSLMAIGSIIDAALQIILLPFTFIWENCKDVVVEKLTAIKDYVSEKLDEIKNFFSEKLGPVKDIVSEKFSAVKDKITETMSTVKDYVGEKLNNIKTAYEENGGGVKSVVSATMEGVKQYYSIGYDAINKLTGGKLGEAVNIVSGKLEEVKNYFNEKLENVKNIVVDKFNAIKSSVQEKLSLVFNIVSEKLESIKNTMSDKINAAKNIVVDKFNAIKDSIQQKIDSAKNSVNNAVNNIKEKFNVFGEAVNTVSNIFENIKNTISDKINAAKDVVSDSINRIKNLFNFSWKLPDLKLPHFKINGEFSLNPPSVPTLGVEWYANGGILQKPTMFGINEVSGKAMVGGEAGPEAVAPIDTLQAYIKQAVSEQNSELLDILKKILEVIIDMPKGDYKVVLDTGILVGEMSPKIDKDLGKKYKKRSRE